NELPCEELNGEEMCEVKLISCTPDPDMEIAKTAIASHLIISYEKAECIVNGLDREKLKELITKTLKYRMPYDTVKRYYEFAEASYEVVVSSSNYAQLKRHRPASMLPGPYDISLGVTLPENIKAVGMENRFNEVIEKTNNLYSKMKEIIPYHSQYILTNAHRRKVILKMNFRELYHFMSLRLDEHAQWDIRNTAELMLKELSVKAPFSSLMMCGKSCFRSKNEEVFG
ncbi:MAG: FAD-dependent thymidylate synthase, partial [Candidatus Delongbacteria bacterium]|nr:FAD-dependent thymidylate synthase [Candidatus Delongbacteria bacterium]